MTSGVVANAQEWPRLLDGRVVVTVKDVAVAFPTQGPDLRDIRFYIGLKHMELGQVIAAPDKARHFFSENDVQQILIPNLEERAGLFLGRFDRKPLYGFRFSVGPTTASLNNCRAWLEINNKYRERIASEHIPVDAHGWAEFIQPKSPQAWHYIRAHDLPGLPEHFDSFNCDAFGVCAATMCIGSKASFVYRFSRKLHKRDSWNDVVGGAADVFHFLFDYDSVSGR
jgi:hypothetical protein